MSEETKKVVSAQKELKAAVDDSNKSIKKQEELIIELADPMHNAFVALQEAQENWKKINKITSENHETIKKSVGENQEIVSLLKEKLKILKESGQLETEAAENLKEQIKLYEEELDIQHKIIESFEKRKKQAEELAASTKTFLQNLTGITDKSTTIFSNYLQTLKTGGPLMAGMTAGIKQFFGMENITEGAGKVRTVLESLGNFATNIFTSLLDSAIKRNLDFIRELENTEKQIMMLTGAGEKAKNTLYESFTVAKNYGVAIAEVGNAMLSLSENVNKFNQMNSVQQESLIKNIALLNEVGIKTADSTKLYNNLTTGLKMNHTQAIETTRSMAAYGAALGSNQKATQELNDALKILSGYGAKGAIEVFDQLAHQAYATGLEIKSLLSIAGKFDTFEDAATAAAGLNAILGGPLLNSTDLLVASESERIDMLMKSINASGKAWGELNKFEQKAIASRVGIDDLAEANKIFGKSFAEYEAGKKESERLAIAQKSIEERAIAAQTVMDRWQTVLDTLIIKTAPLVNILEKVLTFVIELNESMGGGLFIALGIVTGAFMLMKFVLAGLGPALQIAGLGMNATAAASKPAAAGMETLGNSLSKLGGSAAGAAKGIAVLAAVAGVFLIFAGSVWILVDAIIRLIPHLSSLFTIMTEHRGALAAIGVELLAFGLAMNMFATMIPGMSISMAVLAGFGFVVAALFETLADDSTLIAFIKDLALLASNVDKLSSIPQQLAAISISLKETFAGLNVFEMIAFAVTLDTVSTKLFRYASAISQVADAFNKMTSGGKFAVGSNPIAIIAQETNKLTEEKVKLLERFSSSTIKIIESSKNSGNSEGIISSIKDLIQAVNVQTNTIQNKENNVNVTLNSEGQSVANNSILHPRTA